MAKPKGDKTKSKSAEKNAEKVRPAITQSKLKSLLASARSTKADVDEIVGTHRQQIAEAVEKNYLHKGAFGMIKRLDRLEPEKLADWLDCLEHYLDISGLDDRAKSAPRMALEVDEEVDETNGAGARTRDPKLQKAFPAPVGAGAD